MKELVSIVVPVYNVRQYLDKCIECLINQTYRCIEIIIVDDGSTDESGEMCDKYGKIDNRIKVIHQNNQGLSCARNVGIHVSKGSYITFVDSDDFVDTTYIEKMICGILGEDADLSICGTIYCDDHGQYLRTVCTEREYVFDTEKHLKELLSGIISTTAWGKLYKKSLFDDICFPNGKYHEDVYTTYKVLAQASKSVILPKALYWYRQTLGSITNRKFEERHMDALYACIERHKFIKESFPKLGKYSRATIAETGKDLLRRIMEAREEKTEESKITFIKKNVRQNILHFLLFSQCSNMSKVFALCSSISVRVTARLYRHITRGKHVR